MYLELITDLNIPDFYILLHEKTEINYNFFLNELLKILTLNNNYNLNIKVIVTETELAPIKSVKSVFPNSQIIAFYFHYTQDIITNIRS